MNWISVNERLPESGQTVLCSNGVSIELGKCIHWESDNRIIQTWSALHCEEYDLEGITHWTNLPEPPRE